MKRPEIENMFKLMNKHKHKKKYTQITLNTQSKNHR